jgi:predicted NAD-dependent protein-ADP-ribosyltransferase YbiA (DUF1768 family)
MPELDLEGQKDPFRLQRNEAGAAGANALLVLTKRTMARRNGECPGSSPITDCPPTMGAWFEVVVESYTCTPDGLARLASLAPPTRGRHAAAPAADRSAYPAHWWTAVPAEGAPEWEILPQQAGPGEVILSKRNELGLLSNFAATPFTFHGQRYASLEGFWQMMLYPEEEHDPRALFPGLRWQHTRAAVAQLSSFEAKAAGTLAEENMKAMGINWVTFEGRRIEYRPAVPGEHYLLIAEATREKVKQNPEVEKVLLATGDLVLKPDHTQEPNAPAAWRYFEILTTIRAELRRQ